MKGKLFAVITAVFLFCGIAQAVSVSSYDSFQQNLLLGNNIELNSLTDIVKASTHTTALNIPSSLTITGNNRRIDMNGNGNMFTVGAPNVTVTMASFTARQGNYATNNGGAINMTGANSRLNVNGNSFFDKNRSSYHGGAIAATSSSSLYFTGNTTFSNNTATLGGGAIYLAGTASADFTGTQLSASENYVNNANGGFMSVSGTNNVRFGSASFTGNSATANNGTSGRGGAIYSSGSSNISFTGNILFSGNSAFSAGAMYITAGTTATFSGSNTVFEENYALDEVGALYVRNGSRVVFQGTNTTFRNNRIINSIRGTGAVDIAYNSSADFRNTNLIAQGNDGDVGGLGGFLWADSSSVLFGNALIGGINQDDGNRAKYGAGIFANNFSTITFSGTGSTIFRNNRASADGGGLFMSTNSVVNFNTGASTSTRFQNNRADGKGGAAAITGFSTLSFYGDTTYFDGNSAGFGGAISVESGSVLNITNGYFTANNAASAGGAVYLRGDNVSSRAVLRSNTTSAGLGVTLFRGNSVNGTISNAIYLDDYSSAYFNTAAGTSVEMYDGITGSTNTTTYFEVSGAGDFNLHGTFDTINLNIAPNGTFNLKSGALFRGNTLNNAAGSRFSMQNGAADAAYMMTLNNNGTIAMDLLQGENDKIFVSRDANLNTSTLEVKADDMTDVNFRKKIYRLINYDTQTGSFTTVNIISPAAPSSYHVGYGEAYANWVTLALLGNKATTDFSKIGGETFNQNEAAKALDKISGTVTNYDPWDLALADIETYSDDGIKKILTGLAGYFLPNVIRNAAADSPNNEIYDRIKNHCMEGHTVSNGFWIQARGGVESFYENDNSPEDYKDTSVGVMAGYDRFMEERNLMLGIYGRLNKDSIEQGRHEADGTKTGIGIYGGYIKEDWEFKALTLLSFDSFDVKRYVPYANAMAKSDIKTTTFSFDFEGALKFDMALNTKFRPYAGLEFANANYKDFSESGAGMYSLDVDGGNYLRSAGRVGAGLHYEKDIWYLYGNLEGKYLFSGTEPEIENVFDGTSASFKTRGTEEGALEIGVGAGASVILADGLKLFANANYYGADNYSNLFGNIGLRYTFCNPFSVKRAAPEPDNAQENYVPVAVTPPAPKSPRPEDIDMNDARVVEAQKLEAMERRTKPMLKSYSLNMASFDVGKADLKEAAKKDIAREAEEIKKFQYKRIIIEGHTDSTGSDELNRELSKNRAESVFNEFASHGIPEEKMFYIGFGPAMPRDTNKTAEGRASNRRVEIFVE